MLQVRRYDATSPLAKSQIGSDSALLVVYDFGAVERMVNLLRSIGALATREPDATFVAREVQAAAVDLSRLLIGRISEANGIRHAGCADGARGLGR